MLGSAGGPRQALDIIGADTFLIVNGDTLTDVDLARRGRPRGVGRAGDACAGAEPRARALRRRAAGCATARHRIRPRGAPAAVVAFISSACSWRRPELSRACRRAAGQLDRRRCTIELIAAQPGSVRGFVSATPRSGMSGPWPTTGRTSQSLGSGAGRTPSASRAVDARRRVSRLDPLGRRARSAREPMSGRLHRDRRRAGAAAGHGIVAIDPDPCANGVR